MMLGAGGVIDSRFSPLSLRVRAWLDASDPAGNNTLPSNGSALTTWVDKSGNSHNAGQATTLAKPTYILTSGQSAISFDGTQQFLTIPYNANLNAANMSIYIVCTVKTLPGTFGEVISSVSFGATMEGYTPLIDNTGKWAWYVGNGTGAWNVTLGANAVVDDRVLLRWLFQAIPPLM
jgi:hypothetical protein